jgi:hypothetical protein
MNKKLFCRLLAILVLANLLGSCWDDTSYRDTIYPDQLIYMPAAYDNNQFVIDDINRIRGEHPLEGNPYRYIVDVAKNEFRVPLSAYRSGINNKGSFTVNINVNTEIISLINANLVTPYLLIPSDKYSLVNSVEMKDGEELALFDLIIDLDFLLTNFPDKIYSIGVEISSTQRETSPDLGKTAVVIHTKMVKPTANFSYEISSSQEHYVNFTNSSLMSLNYQWDFGDGSEISKEISPAHKYSAAGTYVVTLTALGITGEQDKSIKTIEITIP